MVPAAGRRARRTVAVNNADSGSGQAPKMGGDLWRLFVAISPPVDVKDQLKAMQAELRDVLNEFVDREEILHSELTSAGAQHSLVATAAFSRP